MVKASVAADSIIFAKCLASLSESLACACVRASVWFETSVSCVLAFYLCQCLRMALLFAMSITLYGAIVNNNQPVWCLLDGVF